MQTSIRVSCYAQRPRSPRREALYEGSVSRVTFGDYSLYSYCPRPSSDPGTKLFESPRPTDISPLFTLKFDRKASR